MVETAEDLTPKERKMVEEARRIFRESESGPPIPENLRKKMQDQALTNAALADKNSQAWKAYHEVTSMSEEEFRKKFGDILYKDDDQDAA